MTTRIRDVAEPWLRAGVGAGKRAGRPSHAFLETVGAVGRWRAGYGTAHTPPGQAQSPTGIGYGARMADHPTSGGKCGFQWTGVGLYRIRAIKSSAPLDRFRLDRGLWASLKAWGRVKEVA